MAFARRAASSAPRVSTSTATAAGCRGSTMGWCGLRWMSNCREQWHVISQGNGTSRDEQGVARWDSDGLVEQIYLVGGPLLRYSDAAGAVEALVYLREQDDALARKYLDATAQYLEMYRQLIGPYPYGKFALVENFWETGYGMPSFTLLGPQVIRFPFILHSSYPHEILHNWWGNSVFVDYEKGNWCEGLTAYLADHLVQEQRGWATNTAAARCRSTATTCATGGISRSPNSASGTARRPRRWATARP